VRRILNGVKNRSPKILLIDDDKTVVSVVSAMLRAAGYQVVSALDPVQGFMAVRREKPQLIVLDIMMPAGGGMQLLQRLTSVGEVPVIVMTALTDGKVEAEAKAAQAGEDGSRRSVDLGPAEWRMGLRRALAVHPRRSVWTGSGGEALGISPGRTHLRD
jgi:CheY-like chemotaxis protein